MRAIVTLALFAVALARPAHAGEPSGEALAEASQMGAVASLAPICRLRDEAWSSDLRRAMMRSATGTQATDDDSLKQASGGNKVAAALGYGDMEALEDLAADTRGPTCDRLRALPALGRADAIVKEFRRLRGDANPVG